VNLDLQSEQYSATGNISGVGVERSLGSPSLDRLRLFVRETVQNAWDARDSDEQPVQLRFRVRKLTGLQRSRLSELLVQSPPGGPAREQIAKSVEAKDMSVLEIADFRTVGLGGPVRADRIPVSGERPNFVNFFRNIGSPRNKELGGGTYGYGKSSVFSLSSCRTMFAYSRSTDGGKPVSRLMAANVSDPFENRRKRFTGRHWWGVRAGDGTVDPLDKEKAHRAAVSIGMERRESDELGTTLMVLDPVLDSRSLRQTANSIAESLAWFFWPKMLQKASDSPAMTFEVEFEGEAISVPSPSDFPPLATMANAMSVAKGSSCTIIRCERPIKVLGRFGLARDPVARRIALDTGNEDALIPDRSSHIALMRPAELVVKYLVGPRLPSDFVEYAGVFICDEEVEPDFAGAEPPAHDDWVPDHLEGHSRTYVKVALRRLVELVDQYANPLPGIGRTGNQESLAVIGDALGGVIMGQTGSRVGFTQRAGQLRDSPNPRKAVTISDPEPFRYAVVRKVPCALFRIRIAGRSNGPISIQAKPFVVLEGGSSPEASGLASPQVIAWLSGDGDPLSTGDRVNLRIAGDVSVIVAVSIPGDCAIGVEVAAQEIPR
jgi:hypothetical protein